MFPALRDVLECVGNAQAFTSSDSSASAAAAAVPPAARRAMRLIICSLLSNEMPLSNAKLI